MRDKIVSQLKAYLQTLGVKNLSNTRIDAIADKLSKRITEESQIEEQLTELNDLTPFAEMARLDDYDRTQKARAKQQQQQSQDSQQQQQSSDDPIAKELAELKAWKLAVEKEKQQAKLQETFTKKLSEKKIPAQLAKGRTIESEEQLEAVITEIESDYTALKQQLINDGLSTSTQPVAASASPATVDADIAAWAAKK